MAKSKEEILDVWYKPKMHWKLVNRDMVLKAMDEYARQEAIAFRYWMDTWGYRTKENEFWFNQVPEAGKQTLFTLGELYTLYLTTK